MSNALHKAPLGFLEALNLKTLGQQPNEVGLDVGPSIDVTEFYIADRLFSASTDNTAGAISQTQTLDISFVRLWRMIAVSVTVGAAAGTWLKLRIAARVPSASSQAITLLEETVVPRAAAISSACLWLPEKFIFPPGSQLLFSSAGDAGGADHVLSSNSLTHNLASQS